MRRFILIHLLLLLFLIWLGIRVDAFIKWFKEPVEIKTNGITVTFEKGLLEQCKYNMDKSIFLKIYQK